MDGNPDIEAKRYILHVIVTELWCARLIFSISKRYFLRSSCAMFEFTHGRTLHTWHFVAVSYRETPLAKEPKLHRTVRLSKKRTLLETIRIVLLAQVAYFSDPKT